MKILVLDNYDSFTWNLVHAIEAAGAGREVTCLVHRSDRIALAEVEALAPGGIVLSPGPFGPDQAGICSAVVKTYRDRVPILGVCLGMQVIAKVMGADVRPSGRPMHGKASQIRHDGNGLLRNLPNPFWGGRYHSLVIDASAASPELEISAWSDGDDRIMGCRLRGRAVEGVLFHPESFLTEHGSRIFENFVEQITLSQPASTGPRETNLNTQFHVV